MMHSSSLSLQRPGAASSGSAPPCRNAAPGLRPTAIVISRRAPWSAPGGRARSVSRAAGRQVVAYIVPKGPLPSQDGGAAPREPGVIDAKRLKLRRKIADQLQGPHFETWMDDSRFLKDRLVIQARRLWYYSSLLAPDALAAEGQFSNDQLERLRVQADKAFEDLKPFKLDGVPGGWRFSLPPAKPSSEDPAQQICMYGVCFALYGLSTYVHATGSADARQLAEDTFDALFNRRAEDGGLAHEAYELNYNDPLQRKTEPFLVEQDALGHWLGRRCLNTHIHLVEALTAYHRFVAKTSDSVSRRERSSKMLKGVADLVVEMKPAGSPRIIELRDSTDARKPATDLRTDVNIAISKREKVFFLPGHNVEATFLVHDAADVLEQSGPDATWTMEILEEAEHRMRSKPGGKRWLPHILQCISTSDPATCKDFDVSTDPKLSWEQDCCWWAQMELLNALVHADQRLGGPDGVVGDTYIDRAIDVWDTVKTCFVQEDGSLMDNLVGNYDSPRYLEKADEADTHGPWKASYHTTRALLRSLQALSEGFKPALHPKHWQDLQAEC